MATPVLTGRRGTPAALGIATLVLLALPSQAARSGATARPDRGLRPPATCVAAVQHPLAVRVEPLDPIQRGAAVRLRVTTSSRLGFERGEVRLSSSGGAAVAGASRATLGAVPAGGQASADFTVRIPRQGHRFLVQFHVQAEGTGGSYARGATYNLLPDGPSERARVAATREGQPVLEVTARRLEP